MKSSSCVLLCLVVLSMVLVAGCETQIKDGEEESFQNCMKEKQKEFGYLDNYVGGKIYIYFIDGTDRDKALFFISSYNLTVARDRFPEYLVAEVPSGEEIKWICLLEQKGIIRTVKLSLKGTTA